MSIIRVERHAPLKRIGNVLREAKSVLVFVHVNIDGDTIRTIRQTAKSLDNKLKCLPLLKVLIIINWFLVGCPKTILTI